MKVNCPTREDYTQTFNKLCRLRRITMAQGMLNMIDYARTMNAKTLGMGITKNTRYSFRFDYKAIPRLIHECYYPKPVCVCKKLQSPMHKPHTTNNEHNGFPGEEDEED